MRPSHTTTLLLWFALALLPGCSEIGGIIYESQMRASDAVELDDGSWSDLDLIMSESEKACMAERCVEARADEDTYTACFKETCREKDAATAPAPNAE